MAEISASVVHQHRVRSLRPILLVATALVIALVILAVVGRRVLESDRDAMYDRYAQDRLATLQEAAHAFAGDIADIGEDLDLASTLLKNAESPQVAERELNAVATIKREYMMMDARANGRTTRVVAFDSPKGVAERANQALATTLDLADASPGVVRVSGALRGDGERDLWNRVYARRPNDNGPTVAVVVDLSILFAHSKVQRAPDLRLLVADAAGNAAPISNLPIAVVQQNGALQRVLTAARTDQSLTSTVSAEFAASIGLPATRAVAIAVPVHVDEGIPWTILVVASTNTLEQQERTLVHRVLVGGGVILLLLLLVGLYAMQNTRRTATLRERVRHIEHLAHLTEKAEKIVEHIPSGVLTVSADQRITSANRWFADRGADAILDRDIKGAFAGAPADDVALLTQLIERAVATRTPQSVHRTRFELFSREAFYSINVVPLEHSAADVGLLVVFDDLTQQRQFEDRLLHSEKLITAGQLAAGIAHEIGTPLNVARGRVELALSHLGAEHAEAGNHRIVIDQIDRVTRLIQQLLDYVRPTPATTQHVDVGVAMSAVVELLTPQATRRDVILQVEVASDLPMLMADADQVQQLLMNLTMNAIDACSRDGHVKLRATMRERALVIEVIDDGHGISRDIQAHVFDPFFTTKKRGQGTGRGLWIVAQLLRAHAARVEIDSAAGQGTTMRITWPVQS